MAGFDIPDNDIAFNKNQSIWMSTDIDILTSAFSGVAVLTGCAVTAQSTPNMTVAVASGTVRSSAGLTVAVTSGNKPITAAHATLPRIDLVAVATGGGKVVIDGIASASPKAPDLPTGYVGLAMVYVPASVASIPNTLITDKRVILPVSVFAGTGTSFPSGPSTNDQFYRLDLQRRYVYDGSDWIGPEEEFTFTGAALSASGNTDWSHAPFVDANIKLTGFHCASLVLTTNDASNFWTIELYDVDTGGALGTAHGSYATTGDGTTSYVGHWVSNNDVVNYSTRRGLLIRYTKTLSPGNLYFKAVVRFRRIAT